VEKIKQNEVLYIQCKNLSNFSIFKEKEVKKEFFQNYLIKIRIITNQLVKINYGYQNLLNNRSNISKEINFFGLLLKVSKEYLTPTYNLIIHIHGGGLYTQSSESHLDYLFK
jgi:hypothetical protein